METALNLKKSQFLKSNHRIKLELSFYQKEDVIEIAKSLLGKYLFTKINGQITGGKIVETEAYAGLKDKASHSYGGRRTARNETMYQAGGIAYVYLCYGIHHLFNIVTGSKDDPQAVLIRAIEPVCGIKTMLKRRNMKKLSYQLTSGPGSLTRALGLTMKQNGQSLSSSTLWLEESFLQNQNTQKNIQEDQKSLISNQKQLLLKEDIISSPRVGIAYAEEDALLPWRFRIRNNPWCSKAKS